MKIIKITFEDLIANTKKLTCFECPLKWSCGLWLNDVWNVNREMCTCTDERLVCGIDKDNPLIPKREDLLKLFQKGIDTTDIM